MRTNDQDMRTNDQDIGTDDQNMRTEDQVIADRGPGHADERTRTSGQKNGRRGRPIRT